MKSIVFAAALAAFSVTATADDFTLSGEAGATTNYMWRGVSQSQEEFAVQAGVEGGYKGFSLGLWGSSVDFNDGDQASVELDIYGGYTFTLTDSTSLDVGGVYYMYPGASSNLNYDFWEVNAGVTHTFQGGIEVGGKVSYSPDYFGNTGDAYYFEGNVTVPVWKGLYVDGHVGHSNLDENKGLEDYTDYGVGVGYALEHVDVRLGYVDTDMNNVELANDQWTLTGKVTF